MKFLEHIERYARIFRDIGLIFGVPALFAIGIGLHNEQVNSLKLQQSMLNEQINSLKLQQSMLKDTQYDKALSLLKSQKELHDTEIGA